MIVAVLMLLVVVGDVASALKFKVSPEAQTAIDSKSQYQWITFKVDRRDTLQLIHAEPMRLSNVQTTEKYLYEEYAAAKKEALDVFSEFLEGLPSNEALLAYFFFPVNMYSVGANPFLMIWSPSNASPYDKYVQESFFRPIFLSKFRHYIPYQQLNSIDDGNNILERIF